MRGRLWKGTTVVAFLGLIAACGPPPGPASAPPPPGYAALPDTVVCVVDRASDRGLRALSAKTGETGVVVFLDGAVRPLEEVHPIGMIAGYAGAEEWLRRGDPVSHGGRRYLRTGGERRIGLELLRRIGDHEGILLFAGEEDPPPPDALYVPTAPGCIFQPYVREDLL
jgi:hypothetical protein